MNKSTLNYLNGYSLFIAFPGLLVFGLNLSLFFFSLLFLGIRKKKLFFQTKNPIQIVVALFFIGAVISVLDLNASLGLKRSLAVLPNFFYWSILVIFLINIRQYINHLFISKYLLIGLLISTFYFFVFPSLPRISGFINPITLNSFAFLCICFTAPSAVYILKKKGYLYAFLFSLLMVGILLTLGRRAGTVLVFFSSFMAITFASIKLKNLFFGLLLFVLGFLAIQINTVENAIYKSSPRIHQLIYENDEIDTEDRSLLTRKLMLEKAYMIFSEHPLTGIGLNNFSNYDVSFSGDFEGAMFVINKQGMNEKSAHNSYVALLAEGGLFLIIPFLLILLYNFYHFVRSFGDRTQIQNAFYWSFLAMCVHLYFISAIVNVYAWFLIGIVTALSVQSQKGELKWLFNYPLNKG